MRAFKGRPSIAVIAVMAAALALTACGRKGPPEAPLAATPAAEETAETP